MHSDFLDRRESERIPVDLWVQQIEGDIGVLHPAANLSEGGIFLYTDRMKIGEEHEIEFSLPGAATQLRLRARVVWKIAGHRPMGVGLRFLFLDEATRETLRRWAVAETGSLAVPS